MHTFRRALSALLVMTLFVYGSRLRAEPPSTEEARTALQRATAFFHKQIASHGGYVYQYSADLSLREGEGETTPETVWVQPPGTPSVGLAYLEAFERTGEPSLLEAAKDAADCLIKGQLLSGAWNASIEFEPTARAKHAYRVEPLRKRARNWSTFDDDKSQSALRFLMRLDRALKFEDERLHECVTFALNSVLTAQFPNGGWPQGYEAPVGDAIPPDLRASIPNDWARTYPGGDYWVFPTTNDNAHVDTMETLFRAAVIYDDARYREAALRGAEFLLKAQLPEPQPAWAQQYNFQMEPCWARKFEPPAISGGESQSILSALLLCYVETGDRKFLDPIPRALNYLEKSALPDGRLSRFYELGTNRPLFFTREYQLTFDDSDLPTHYSFKVTNRTESIRRRFSQISAFDDRKRESERAKLWDRRETPKKINPDEVRRIVDSLDERGAWVERGDLKHHRNQKGIQLISSATFATNLDTLSRFVSSNAR
jgi:hypothetical protein